MMIDEYSKPAAGRFLIGRPGFYFEPPNGPGSPGAPSTGSPPQNTPGQQQQQQSPAAPVPPAAPNPFEGLDLDLLDDRTRRAVEESQRHLQSLQTQANQASTFQSESDRLKTQLAETQRQVQEAADPRNQQRQQQQQQQQQQEPLTLEQETEQYYISQGIEAKMAQQLAKLNAPLFERIEKRTVEAVDKRYTPIVARTLEASATDAFQEAQMNDRMGAFQIPDIAQKVYDRAIEMSQRGQIVDANVLTSLSKIFYFDHLEANGGQLPNQNVVNGQIHLQTTPAPVMHPYPTNQPTNMNTRHTYPGAGNAPRLPAQRQSNEAPVMSADERAAMEATVSHWAVKPKQFRPAAKP